KPEVDVSGVPVSKAEVKQIQRNLKTMPLEDVKSPNSVGNESKDMDDVESDQGSNEDLTQDKLMDESSQQPVAKSDVPTPSSDIDSESANTIAHSTSGEKNGKEIRATASPVLGGGFSNTSSVSPFANVKPGQNLFGSSSLTPQGFNTASTSPSSVQTNHVFGSKSTPPSGGFINTSSVSPFAAVASTNALEGGSTVFGGKSAFGNEFGKSSFGSESTKSPFGSDSAKSVFGQSSTTSAMGFGASASGAGASTSAFGASSENSTDSTAGSVFGAKSVVGSMAGAGQSLQKPTPFPARLQSTSGSFGTFGSFSKEASFTSGSFMVDQDNSQDQDFGSLLSQDTGDDNPEQADGEENFGTGIFTNADQIDVPTGEEDEFSIYQTKGKLYADTEKTHAWKERGKGAFKVNVSQKDTNLARLVMRTDGALRLILNVAIFPDMNVVITSDKYVRFIGIEEGKPISFLLKVKDASTANDIVDSIRRASERQAKGRGDVTSKE
ncbi:hypothetical protein BGZ49_001560, partial [Haplosporangium sp. Z 27]